MNPNGELRLMTDQFRVSSVPQAPLFQIPPQKGFPTTQRLKDKVPLRDQDGRQVGLLIPVFNKHIDAHLFDLDEEDLPVCVVEASHSANAAVPDIRQRKIEGPRTATFLCNVTYAVEVDKMNVEAMVSGPRMVAVGEPYTAEDGRRTVELEITEMYLAGYVRNGALITVRGGKNLGLPVITGQVKADNGKHDFPASLHFDLTLEVAYWGELM